MATQYAPTVDEQVVIDWLSHYPFHGHSMALYYDHDDGYDHVGLIRHGIREGWQHQPIRCSYCGLSIEPRGDAMPAWGNGLQHPACRALTDAEREEAARPAKEAAAAQAVENARIAAERGHRSYRRIEPETCVQCPMPFGQHLPDCTAER